jgi:radical SAM protein with 4Fe4S-binding SPASM domain
VLNAACPSRCVYCAIETQRVQRTLTRDEVTHAAREIVANGFAEVIFVGGEPLLSPDLSAALDALDGRCNVAVFTGGIPGDPTRYVDVLRRGVGRLVVSLDAGDEALNDRIRGRSGITNDLARLVDAVLRALPRVQVSVNTVVTRHNVDHIDTAWERALGWNATSWSLTLAGDNFDGASPDGHFLSRAQVEQLYLDVIPRLASLLTSQHRELVVLPIPLPFLERGLAARHWGTAAPHMRASLDAEFDRYARGDFNASFVAHHGCPLVGVDITVGIDGSVYPCSQAPIIQEAYALGSITQRPLREVLTGDRMNRFREGMAHPTCTRCHAPSNVQRPVLVDVLTRKPRAHSSP